jgi:flagellar biosynthetic protein FliP
MTVASYLGVLGTLGIVLGVLLLALKLLRKYAPGAVASRGAVPLEVLQRIPLGPRQAIALVRVGEQVLAVSVGDGGVRPLAQLSERDRDRLAATGAPSAAARSITAANVPAAASARAEGGFDFRDALRVALRSATRLAVLAAAASLAAGGLQAQAPAPAGRPAAAPAPAAPRALPGVVTRNGVGTPAAADSTPRAAPVVPPVPASGGVARADTMLTRLAPRVDLRVGETNGGLRLSGTVGVVVMMGLLTLLPTLLLMMTGFTRILIVLHFLKQALGTQSAPPAHLVSGLALLLTGFVMAPTLSEVNRTALQPWMDGRIEQAEMLSTGVKPFREFMLRQTRDRDIQAFIDMSAESDAAAGNPVVEPTTPDDVSLVVLVSAFVTSELRTAFQLGFALFLPFIVIDVVVSSVLMSMGMFMLPPAMIALPFKLLLFVLVDGWGLVVQSLVQSFK